MEFKHFDQIRSLIREAIEHLNNMGRQDGKQLVPVFVDARKLLAVLNKNIEVIKFERFRPGLIYIYPHLVKNLQRSKK